MQCIHCQKDAPDGACCTWCGKRQLADTRQITSYALHPREHVVQPSVITTLFPHIDAHKAHDFRWALIAGVGCILVLALAGLIVGALLCAAFLLPILYLLYLYEAQVYRDEPARVLGFTIGGGVIVGIVVTVLVKTFTGSLSLRFLSGDDVPALLTLGVLVPIVQEILKPIPALLLRGRPAFPERVDGLVFGVAAGLGFSIAETLVRFSSVITTTSIQTTIGAWTADLLTLAVLLPLLHGSATGAITAALWRRGRGSFGVGELATIGCALAAHIGFNVGSQLLADRGVGSLLILAWQATMVGALLIVIRYLLHRTLSEEATHMGFQHYVCPNCHNSVAAVNFCPLCGRSLGSGRDRGQAPPVLPDTAPRTVEVG